VVAVNEKVARGSVGCSIIQPRLIEKTAGSLETRSIGNASSGYQYCVYYAQGDSIKGKRGNFISVLILSELFGLHRRSVLEC
jgi:hypothetical protein